MHTPVSYIAVGATGSDGSQYISDWTLPQHLRLPWDDQPPLDRGQFCTSNTNVQFQIGMLLCVYSR